ncbi:TPA: hypothetical protein ACRRW5_002188 [Klebsiella quasipneumoniae]|uniref:hypothetical protein n=1 Tax=Klebsiella quasipneumoniae TaxID=1463165 RepID=UPI00352AC179
MALILSCSLLLFCYVCRFMLRRPAQKVKGGGSGVTPLRQRMRYTPDDKKPVRDRVLINVINTTFLNSATVTKARKKPAPALQGQLIPLYVKFVFIN